MRGIIPCKPFLLYIHVSEKGGLKSEKNSEDDRLHLPQKENDLFQEETASEASRSRTRSLYID